MGVNEMSRRQQHAYPKMAKEYLVMEGQDNGAPKESQRCLFG